MANSVIGLIGANLGPLRLLLCVSSVGMCGFSGLASSRCFVWDVEKAIEVDLAAGRMIFWLRTAAN